MILAIIAMVSAGIPLIGWALHTPLLATFNSSNYPVWPITAVGHLCLAGGLALSLARRRFAPLLLAVPLLIAAIVVVEELATISPGVDRLLFPNEVIGIVSDHPGRPGANTVLSFVLLASAVLLVRRPSVVRLQTAGLFASIALCVGLYSFGTVLLLDTGAAPLALFAAPLPAGIATIAIALAFLSWQRQSNWAWLVAPGHAHQPWVWLALPIAIALPILPFLFEHLVAQAGDPPALGATLLAALINAAVVGAILIFAADRLRQQRDALAAIELQASEQRALVAAEINEIGMLRWDVASGVFHWSPGSEQRLGLRIGSMASIDDWRAMVHPDDAESVFATVDRATAEAQDRFTFQFRLALPGEPTRTIEGFSRCVYDAGGKLVRTDSSMLDVTKRVVRDAELRLQSIIETVPDATVVIDARGIVSSFSAVAEAMFGFSAAETIGRNVSMLMPDWIANGHDASIARYFATGERKVIGKTRELTARRSDGSLFPIELNVGETRIGNDVTFTGIIRDVSDRLSSEKRLSDLSSELAHVSRQSAMSELAADLAHELNQPLSATANFLGAARILVAQGEQGERVAEMLQMAEGQTLRSGEIIRRLRDFLSKREVEMRPESLEDIIDGAVELVLFGVAQSDVSLTLTLDPQCDMIFVDRIQIQQVLVNLLRNSVEVLRELPATQPKEITIESRVSGNAMVEVALCDNGPGIPEAVSEHLYERFATSKSGGAMGIGLSISRRIIEGHGGVLTAGNRQEGGAVFRFTLPAMEDIDDDA